MPSFSSCAPNLPGGGPIGPPSFLGGDVPPNFPIPLAASDFVSFVPEITKKNVENLLIKSWIGGGGP